MSFDTGETRGGWQEHCPKHCPNCAAEKAYHFRPRPCAEPGCRVLGCSLCLTRCDIDVHEGGFCREHIGVTETGVGSQWPWKGNVCGPCRVALAQDMAVVAKEREKENGNS